MATKDGYNSNCKSCRNQKRRKNYKDRQDDLIFNLKEHNQKFIESTESSPLIRLQAFDVNTLQKLFVTYDPLEKNPILGLYDQSDNLVEGCIFSRSANFSYIVETLLALLDSNSLRIFEVEVEIEHFRLAP